MIIDPFFEYLSTTSLEKYTFPLKQFTQSKLRSPGQGDFSKWNAALDALPSVKPSMIDMSQDAIKIGDPEDLKGDEIKDLLKTFLPWRKGPFNLFGTLIDTEWQSQMKWNRLRHMIQPLEDRLVLDLGCGNGYHLWRMLAEGAKLAMGVDPMWLFFFQFQVLQKYIQDDRISVLPMGIEDLPLDLNGFDTVFSMGLLYHRRDTKEHLSQLRSFLKPGGEIVLETLVIEGGEGDILIPDGRYAKMRNVWNIPSCPTVELWMKEVGFKKIQCVDVTVTSVEEQRVTEWMQFESLKEFLDPNDSSKTIEGYPAPIRAIFIAEKPE